MADLCAQLNELARLFPYFVNRDLLRPPIAVWYLNCAAVDPKGPGRWSLPTTTARRMTLFGGSPSLVSTPRQAPHPMSPTAGLGWEGQGAGQKK